MSDPGDWAHLLSGRHTEPMPTLEGIGHSSGALAALPRASTPPNCELINPSPAADRPGAVRGSTVMSA
jgi:hypothetical protein